MKTILKKSKVKIGVMIFLLMMNMLSPHGVYAYESVDITKKTSLTLTHMEEGHPMNGVEFKVYKVANMTPDANFHVVSEFEDARVSMSTSRTEESWTARAITLEGYLIQKMAEGNPISPTASGVTDSNGNVTMSNLEVGLYLIIGQSKQFDNKIYTPLATLISLPHLEENNIWNYSLSTKTKNAMEDQNNTGDSKSDLSVIKVWKDSGYESKRPEEVTVTLYGDGNEYSTIVLNEKNNWKHTWNNLENNVKWNLVEKNISSAYHVTAIRDGVTFIVTNTIVETPPIPPSGSIPPSDKPYFTLSYNGKLPSESTSPSEHPYLILFYQGKSPSESPLLSLEPGQSLPSLYMNPSKWALLQTGQDKNTSANVQLKLPQTGQLWWPVSYCSMCGLVLLLLGIKLRNKGEAAHVSQ